MVNLNWGTGKQCQNILGNKKTFRDQKAGKKFETNLGTQEHKQIFKGNKESPQP